MNRAIPTINKVLSKKWETENYQKFTKRLEEIQGLVQTKPPVVYAHVKVKAKLRMQNKERNTEIKKDAEILNKKINVLKNKKSEKYGALRIMNTSKYQIAEKQNQIDKSNQELYLKVNNASSNYRLQQFIKDRNKTEERLKNIGNFPYVPKNPLKCKSKHKSKRLVFREILEEGEDSVLMEVFKEKTKFRVRCKSQSMQRNAFQILDEATVHEIVGENRDYSKLTKMINTSDGLLRINIHNSSLPELG